MNVTTNTERSWQLNLLLAKHLRTILTSCLYDHTGSPKAPLTTIASQSTPEAERERSVTYARCMYCFPRYQRLQVRTSLSFTSKAWWPVCSSRAEKSRQSSSEIQYQQDSYYLHMTGERDFAKHERNCDRHTYKSLPADSPQENQKEPHTDLQLISTKDSDSFSDAQKSIRNVQTIRDMDCP